MQFLLEMLNYVRNEAVLYCRSHSIVDTLPFRHHIVHAASIVQFMLEAIEGAVECDQVMCQ